VGELNAMIDAGADPGISGRSNSAATP